MSVVARRKRSAIEVAITNAATNKTSATIPSVEVVVIAARIVVRIVANVVAVVAIRQVGVREVDVNKVVAVVLEEAILANESANASMMIAMTTAIVVVVHVGSFYSSCFSFFFYSLF